MDRTVSLIAIQGTGKERTIDPQAILSKIDERWNELQAAMSGIDPAQASQPGVTGDWSLKDLFGHIAFWDDQATIEAKRRAAGEPPREVDWQALNDEDAAANRALGYDELFQRMQDNHNRLIAVISELPEVDPDAVKDDTWEHYDEHIAEIRAWRDSLKP